MDHLHLIVAGKRKEGGGRGQVKWEMYSPPRFWRGGGEKKVTRDSLWLGDELASSNFLGGVEEG